MPTFICFEDKMLMQLRSVNLIMQYVNHTILIKYTIATN